ncbi:retrotransposon protein, putative, ty1-copia subclass [Tanacetum coccineum]
MHVIEQPLPPAPEPLAEPNVVDQWTALYDAHTKIACLMLGSMTPELHRQIELYYPFDMIQELRSMFEKQAGVEKYEVLVDLPPGCKTVGSKWIFKKKTDMMRSGLKAPSKSTTSSPATESEYILLRSCHGSCFGSEVYISRLEEKEASVGSAILQYVQCFTDYGISVSKNGVLYFNAVSRNGIYEIDMHDLVPNVNSIYNVSNKRVKHNLDSTYLWHCPLAHINKNRLNTATRWAVKAQLMMNLLINANHVYLEDDKETFSSYLTPPTHHNKWSVWRRNRTFVNMVHLDESYNSAFILVWGCEALVKRDTPDKLEQRSVKCIFIGYPKETMGYYFYFPPENKIVVARYAEFFEKRLISKTWEDGAVDWKSSKQSTTAMSATESEYIAASEAFHGSYLDQEVYLQALYRYQRINEL